jgi:MFS family permease
MPLFSFLDRRHTIAGPDFNRWLVPPAALAIHLSVGQVYAFSVFNIPLTKQIGITHSAPGDWGLTQVSLLFSIAIVFLGLSAAVFGKWLEAAGPRKAMFTSALCFGSGLSDRRCGNRAASVLARLPGLRRGRRLSGWGWAIFRLSRRCSNGSPTDRAWRPVWRSWGSAAAR